MRQFYLSCPDGRTPAPGERVELDREESHHLATVLRGGREEILSLVDGFGHRLTGRVCANGGKRAQVEILTVGADPEESRPPALVLACAVVKGKRYEWVLEKAVEAGAHRVAPLLTERTVVDPRSGKRERWSALLVAALKQSGRSFLPQLDDPVSLAAWLAAAPAGPVYFGAVPAAERPHDSWLRLRADLPSIPPPTLTLLVGPEGGWTPAETDRMQQAGASPLDLGPHVLRTETAALAGLVVLQSLRDAWSGSSGSPAP